MLQVLFRSFEQAIRLLRVQSLDRSGQGDVVHLRVCCACCRLNVPTTKHMPPWPFALDPWQFQRAFRGLSLTRTHQFGRLRSQCVAGGAVLQSGELCDGKGPRSESGKAQELNTCLCQLSNLILASFSLSLTFVPFLLFSLLNVAAIYFFGS